MGKREQPYTVGFILEQTLGHVTHSDNLLRNVPADPSVRAQWGLIPWEAKGLGAHIPLYRSNWTLRAGLLARRMVAHMQRQSKLDALFVHTQVPAILLTDKMAQIPTVVSLDATPLQYDMLGDFYAHRTGASWLEAQKKRLNQRCFQRARHLITWSKWTAASLVNDYGVAAAKITVIPPGVNVDEWQRSTPRPLGTQPLGNSAVKILFVGGDLQRKGGDHLLAAVRYLRHEQAARGSASTLELHLVTRSDVQPEAGVFVYRTMQPNSPELKALFHQCDIFCLPTLGDCLPMVLSEAGAAALPIVATNVGAISEIVRDGHTGLLATPGSVESLIATLRTLIQQPEERLRLGENALALVRRHYDAVRNTEHLVSLLKQTIDGVRTTDNTFTDSAFTDSRVAQGAGRRIGHEHG